MQPLPAAARNAHRPCWTQMPTESSRGLLGVAPEARGLATQIARSLLFPTLKEQRAAGDPLGTISLRGDACDSLYDDLSGTHPSV